jgi:class 3 adenylate cyclase
VQEAVDAEGVTFLATDLDADGGKVIIVAGVPTWQEDDEGRLLRAARRIADARPRLPVQIGLNRGHVFAGEIGTAFRSTFTVMGDTVNVAARLAAATPVGRIYATSSILETSRTLFATATLEPLRVKGKTSPLRALAVGVETGSRSGGDRHELPFVGRKEELGVLEGHLDALSATSSTQPPSGQACVAERSGVAVTRVCGRGCRPC